MLVGVCGKAGSGKDTVGDYLVKNYNFKKIALADPIKRLVKDVFVLEDNTVYNRDLREKPLPQWGGWSVRELLQFIGTELFRHNIDDAVWVKSLWFRIKNDDGHNYVVTDVRFPNEINYLAESGGSDFVSIKVDRDGKDGSVGLSSHESEAYDLDAQYELENNGTYEDLYNKIDDVMKKYNFVKIKKVDVIQEVAL